MGVIAAIIVIAVNLFAILALLVFIDAIFELGVVDVLTSGTAYYDEYPLSGFEYRTPDPFDSLPRVDVYSLSDSDAGMRILVDIAKGDIELDPNSTPGPGAKYFFLRIRAIPESESWIELVIESVEHDGDTVRITDSHHPGATFLIPRTFDVAVTNAG